MEPHASSSNPPPHPLQRTVELLEEGVKEGLHLGAQLYVSLRGDTVADLAIGQARPGVPMRTDTSQFWFSCSKPIAAAAIGQLLEQGKLALEDRIADFIPEFAQHGKEDITLFHVMTHTGGFRGSNEIQPGWSWEEVIAFACSTPREEGWIPGLKAGYHHTASWYLLGEIVRRIDGRPYSQYVREEIFLPLGMMDSWVGMPSEIYRSLDEQRGGFFSMRPGSTHLEPHWNEEADSTICRPGSNGRGPVRDLGRFMGMLLDGGRGPDRQILNPDTVELLTRRHRAGMYDETFMQFIDWGLGILLCTRHPGQRVTSYGFGDHASLGAFGHGGMQTSIAFVDPAHELVGVWICNGMCGERLHRQRNHDLNTAIYIDLALASV